MNPARLAASRADWGKRAAIHKPPFHVVIVEDEAKSTMRAVSVLSGLIRQFGERYDFQSELWHFEALQSEQERNEAAQVFRIANLIILSMGCNSKRSAEILEWLETTLEQVNSDGGLLLGLLESSPDTIAARKLVGQKLMAAACRLGWNVILHEETLPAHPDEPQFFSELSSKCR